MLSLFHPKLCSYQSDLIEHVRIQGRLKIMCDNG